MLVFAAQVDDGLHTQGGETLPALVCGLTTAVDVLVYLIEIGNAWRVHAGSPRREAGKSQNQDREMLLISQYCHYIRPFGFCVEYPIIRWVAATRRYMDNGSHLASVRRRGPEQQLAHFVQELVRRHGLLQEIEFLVFGRDLAGYVSGNHQNG